MCRFPPTSVMATNRILIFDTTLRDGEQGPGFSLHVDVKLALARALDALGVDIIEAGFPIASPKDAEAVRRIATEIRRPTIAALARCHRLDLEKTFWALEPAGRAGGRLGAAHRARAPRPPSGPREALRGAGAGGAAAGASRARHLRPAPREEAEHDAQP